MWLWHIGAIGQLWGGRLLCDPGTWPQHCGWFRGIARSGICCFLCDWLIYLGHYRLGEVDPNLESRALEPPSFFSALLADGTRCFTYCGVLLGAAWGAAPPATPPLPCHFYPCLCRKFPYPLSST